MILHFMQKRYFLSLAIMLFVNVTYGQDSTGKKIIDHKVYDGWKSISAQQISDNGRWVSYEIKPQVGDGYLYLYDTRTGKLDSVARGTDAKFMSALDVMVFKIVPQYKVTRKARLDKKKPDDMPKDSLGIWLLEKDSISKIANLKSFNFGETADYIAVHLGKEKKKDQKLTKRQIRKRKKNPPVEMKSDGTTLVLIHPISGEKKSFPFVTEYTVSAKGKSVAWIQQAKGKQDSSFVFFQNAFHTTTKMTISTKFYKFPNAFSVKGWNKSVALDEKGNNLAFLSSTDTAKTNKVWSLYYKNVSDQTASLILDTSNAGITPGRTASENGKIYFSKNGQRLFFGTAPKPVKEPKDTLLDDEKYKLDVWHWEDGRIQTQQLKTLEQDKKFTYLAMYDIAANSFFEISDDSIQRVIIPEKGNGNLALGEAGKKYEHMQTWLSSPPSDYYLIDLSKKTKTKVLEKNDGASISAKGKFLIWFDLADENWYTYENATGTKRNITAKLNDKIHEDNNGLGELPGPCGLMGWTKDDNDVYVYAENDIWKVSPTNAYTPVCITQGKGNTEQTEFRNIRYDKENEELNEGYFLLHTFNHKDKSEGFVKMENSILTPLASDKTKFNYHANDKSHTRVLWSKTTYTTYPDLLVSDFGFRETRKISNTNPQQSNYKWGTVELIKWKSLNGKMLEGLLYKPEDFDSTKKYPMLVYYYEKLADGLHAYRSPRPSASIINPTECNSQGYIVFMPDIEYELGKPGEGAYNSIVSGTRYLIDQGFVDEKNIGLQGQSWGGYQTAFMITQTNIFKAAMAGAPVVNMTSAYGGVRWESGLVRAFQYEKGQSRIGKSLWEDRESYIKNSTLFFLDKVNTPLLVMHNDNDGAVPWYQGIELYTGLRRLQKPVWLLNYNGDGHNLTRRANQMDLSIRMMQFFNHYLKGEPMPVWMAEGIPAVNKGKVTGYDLLKPENKQ